MVGLWSFSVVGSSDEPRIGSAWPYGNYNSARQSEWGKWGEKWGRRAITIPLFTALFVVAVPLALLLLPVAVACDSARGSRYRRQQPLARVLLFFVAYLAAEMAAVWVFGLGGYVAGLALGCLGPASRRWRQWCYTHQHWWGHYLLTAAALRLLGCRQHLDGAHLVTPGATYLTLIRHNSFADTLLPQYLFSDRFRMRYVVKKSLLWDAGLDVMGSRTPNLFLEREAGAGMADELKALTSLLDDAHPEQSEDGTTVRPNIMTCIWPEGTRFSKSKREHILRKLRANVEKLEKQQKQQAGGDDDGKALEVARELLRRAEALKWTLPPRLGGVLALFEKNEAKGADILLCAHSGFEHARDFLELANGGLHNKTIHAKLWRFAWKDMPATREGRIEWLYERWADMDAWVAQQKAREEEEEEKEEVSPPRASRRHHKSE